MFCCIPAAFITNYKLLGKECVGWGEVLNRLKMLLHLISSLETLVVEGRSTRSRYVEEE